jgi:putative nucleotidyltransferase with HDIG domain
MPAASKSVSLARYLPHVLAATFSVAVLPFVAVYGLERARLLTSPIAAAVVGVLLSVLLARFGAFLWMNHSGSKDLVFGDLMLWGFVRRLRTEKRAGDSLRLLGLDRSGKPVREVELSSEKRAEILRDLAHRLELGDPFTQGHTRRVTRYAYMVAKTMGLPGDTVRTIRAAASVHDVGKIETPQEVLNKPGALTDEEFEIMKRHSVTGAEMVSKLGDPEITEIVRHHHERIDGRGYPDGLAGTEIPLGARVIAVADTFDAIISTRPYRAARRHKEAIAIIKRSAGTQLDEHAVNAFLSYYSGRKPLAWWLSLSTAFQRVFGGFGGWLQHAKAGSLSHGTASLAAAVVLTTGAVAMHPAPPVNERPSSPTVSLTGEVTGGGSVGTVALGAPGEADVDTGDRSDSGPDGSGGVMAPGDERPLDGAGNGGEVTLPSGPDKESPDHEPAGGRGHGHRPATDDDPDEQAQPPVVETPVPPVVPPAPPVDNPPPPVDNPGGPDEDDPSDKEDRSCGRNHGDSTVAGDDASVTDEGDEPGKSDKGNKDDKKCHGRGPDGEGPGDGGNGRPCDDGDADVVVASAEGGSGKGRGKTCGDDKGKDDGKDKDKDPKDPTDKDKGTKDDDEDSDGDGDADADAGDEDEGQDDSDDAVDEEVVVDEAPVEVAAVEEPVVVEDPPVVVEEQPEAVEPEPVAVEGEAPEAE